MKSVALILLGIATTAHAQLVRPVQHTNGTVVSPTNFWSKASIQVSNVAGLQAELNSKLSAVSSWSITNVTGLQAALDTKLATNGSLPIGNVSGFSAMGLTFATNTNPATIRQSAGLVLQALTNQTAANFRSAIGLDSAATNPATAFQPSSSALTNLAVNNAGALTNFSSLLLRTNGSAAGLSNFPALNQNTTGTASNVTGVVAITNGGTGATNAGNARGNLGFSANLSSLWTATDAFSGRMALGLVGAGTNSAVGGGTGNTASGQLAVIGGGIFNNATNSNSTVGGGGWNTAGGTSSTVAGGVNNQSSGSWSTIAGGQANTAAAPHSGVAGGNYNTINEGADFAHIGGGLSNTVGGATNYWSNGVTWTFAIPSQSAIVIGGQNNTAVGSISTVAGGANNTAGATYSFAAGRRAKATNSGTFVWADSQDNDFGSTNADSFNVRASGGMSLDLGTNGISFRSATAAAVTRTNLGFTAAWLTNSSPAQFQVDIFTTNRAIYTGTQLLYSPVATWASGTWVSSMPLDVTDPVGPGLPSYKAITRSNLGLGATWLTNGAAPLFWTPVPAATNSTGSAGQVAYTNNFLYICVASNTWRRVQLGTW